MGLNIPSWMTADAGGLRASGQALTGVIESLQNESQTLSATLGSAAGALGWEGQLTDRAQDAAEPNSTALTDLGDALQSASEAIVTFADELDDHGARLRQLERDYADIEPGFMERYGESQSPSLALAAEERRAEERAAIEGEVARHISALDQADSSCRSVLDVAVAGIDALRTPGVSKHFTRTLAPSEPGLWAMFQDLGLVDTADEERIAAGFQEGMSAHEVRELLEGIDLDRLEAFLRRHPAIMNVLASDPDGLTSRDVDPVLDSLWDAIGEMENGQVLNPVAIGEISQYWDSLSPDERYRLRLMYPALIGNLDGVDLAHRSAANLLLLDSAMYTEHERIAFLESLPSNEEALETYLETTPWWHWETASRWGWDLAEGGFIVDARMRDQELQRARDRYDFYSELRAGQPELRSEPVFDGGRMVLDVDQRAVLVFDPREDGRFAEWHGEFDAPSVGIFVPGTTTDMSNISRYNELMRDLGGEPGVAGITWMGTDLPNAIGADATQTRYSEQGGQGLLRFAEGLGLDSGQSLTAIGHSAGGGIVGYADAIGMSVDRTITIAPSGSGLGIEGLTPDEYPAYDWNGNSRDVQRFTQTAPGDPIWVAQNQDGIPFVPNDWGHGTDPNSEDQIIRLETGRDRDGNRVEGHSDVVNLDTDAWGNVVGVVTGGGVIPFQTERPWWRPWRRNVYDDDDYQGTDPVLIDDL